MLFCMLWRCKGGFASVLWYIKNFIFISLLHFREKKKVGLRFHSYVSLCVCVCVWLHTHIFVLKLFMIINFQKYANFVNYVVTHQLPFNSLSVACTDITNFDAYCTVLPTFLSHSLHRVHIFNKIFLGNSCFRWLNSE